MSGVGGNCGLFIRESHLENCFPPIIVNKLANLRLPVAAIEV